MVIQRVSENKENAISGLSGSDNIICKNGLLRQRKPICKLSHTNKINGTGGFRCYQNESALMIFFDSNSKLLDTMQPDRDGRSLSFFSIVRRLGYEMSRKRQ